MDLENSIHNIIPIKFGLYEVKTLPWVLCNLISGKLSLNTAWPFYTSTRQR